MALGHEALVGVKCIWTRGRFLKPRTDLGGLVGAAVVQDEVEGEPRRTIFLLTSDYPDNLST
jgi:hypothetical protein